MSELYAVAASNRYFWQTLAVMANGREAAAAAFKSYLLEPAQLESEMEELEQGARYSPDESNERDDYVYAFDEDTIELVEDDAELRRRYGGQFDETVRMTDSGGKG